MAGFRQWEKWLDEAQAATRAALNASKESAKKLTGEDAKVIAREAQKKQSAAMAQFYGPLGVKGTFKLVVARVRHMVYDVGTQYVRYFRTAEERGAAILRYQQLQNRIKNFHEGDLVYGSEAAYKTRLDAFVTEVVGKNLWSKEKAEEFAKNVDPKDFLKWEQTLANRKDLSVLADAPIPQPISYREYFIPPGTQEPLYEYFTAYNRATGRTVSGRKSVV